MNITLRAWFFIVALCCAGLLGFAFYTQVALYLEPCPLCVFQRVAFMWIGAAAFVGFVHGPGRTGVKFYGLLAVLGAAFGAAIAGRHVWLQHLPPDQVPECGPGLSYMLENFPIGETLNMVLTGSGSCAEVNWTFMGLSMPHWTLLWYLGLGLLTLWFAFGKPNKDGTRQ